MQTGTNNGTIDCFINQYRFLSNFFPSVILLNGKRYITVEHAFQSAKMFHPVDAELVRNTKTAGEAKRLARRLKMREDWETVKVDVMLECLREKFKIPRLRGLLLETGAAQLVEGNWWGDQYWGVCNGEGVNVLGILLMQVREEIRSEYNPHFIP